MEIINVKQIRTRLAELKPLAPVMQKAFEAIEANFDRAKNAITAQLTALEKQQAQLEGSFDADVLAGKEPDYSHIEAIPVEREQLEKRLAYLRSKCKEPLQELRTLAYMGGEITRVEGLLPVYEQVLGRVQALEEALKSLPNDKALLMRLEQENQVLRQRTQFITGGLSGVEWTVKAAKEKGLLKI